MRKRNIQPQPERFESIYTQDYFEVVIDRKTGVNYMIYSDEFVLPLRDSDGKILVTPIPSKTPTSPEV